MRKLLELHDRFGQSPWLGDRGQVRLGGMSLARWLRYGIRGLTSNSAITPDVSLGLSADNHPRAAIDSGLSIGSGYQRELERAAYSSLLLRPVYEVSAASDGFVSVGIPPRFARDSEAMLGATRELCRRIAQPNLMVEVPATSAGVSALRRLISEGRSVNATLIASLARYEQVIEAYLAGLESFEGGLSRSHSVASFLLSPVDTEVNRRLEAIGTHSALSLRGKVALAQAKVAYRMFEERFFGADGRRW
jgi:transaldolase